jgi:methionine biosynthesis protein MetW
MNKSKITDFYEAYWTPREGWTPQPQLTPFKRKLFERFITAQTTVLDVGCGDGAHYGRRLAALAQAYHGLDISDQAVAVAQQNGIQAQQHTLETLFPFPDETFEVALCIEVLEHLFDPAFTLGEIRRVLKQDGHLILSVPNFAHFSNRLRALLGGFAPGGTPETSSQRPWADPHIRFFTIRSLAALIREQNLQLIELHGEGFSFFTTIPVLSRPVASLVGWEKLERWSQPLEFMAQVWPTLCAGHLIAVVARNKSG